MGKGRGREKREQTWSDIIFFMTIILRRLEGS